MDPPIPMSVENDTELVIVDDNKVVKSKHVVVEEGTLKNLLVNDKEVKARKRKEKEV